MTTRSTFAALSTPSGRGAVASIVVWGARAVGIVESLFRSATGRRIAEQPANHILYGVWAPTGEDVIVARRSESRVEVHCHGGATASHAILSHLADAGCKTVTWEELVRADEPSAIRAEARIALAACSTERTAAILLDQYHGALERTLRQIILDMRRGNTADALTRLRELVDWSRLGQHLTAPWRVVIAGPPNVGKSTLINALVGYDRAIVFDQPGTTRDVVTAVTAIGGWPIELADTAGLRSGGEALEQLGVARAVSELAAADLAILVFDITQTWTEEQQQLILRYPDALIVHNKCDRLSSDAPPEDALAGRPAGLLASAKTGERLPTLLDAIVRKLVPCPPRSGEAMPFTTGQIDTMVKAMALVEQGDIEPADAALARLVGSAAGQ